MQAASAGRGVVVVRVVVELACRQVFGGGRGEHLPVEGHGVAVDAAQAGDVVLVVDGQDDAGQLGRSRDVEQVLVVRVVRRGRLGDDGVQALVGGDEQLVGGGDRGARGDYRVVGVDERGERRCVGGVVASDGELPGVIGRRVGGRLAGVGEAVDEQRLGVGQGAQGERHRVDDAARLEQAAVVLLTGLHAEVDGAGGVVGGVAAHVDPLGVGEVGYLAEAAGRAGRLGEYYLVGGDLAAAA